jgi:hypothetical protein
VNCSAVFIFGAKSQQHRESHSVSCALVALSSLCDGVVIGVVVDGLYVYQNSFGLASGQVLHRSQGTLLPLRVNLRYQIRGTMCNARSNPISGKHFDLKKEFCLIYGRTIKHI